MKADIILLFKNGQTIVDEKKLVCYKDVDIDYADISLVRKTDLPACAMRGNEIIANLYKPELLLIGIDCLQIGGFEIYIKRGVEYFRHQEWQIKINKEQK